MNPIKKKSKATERGLGVGSVCWGWAEAPHCFIPTGDWGAWMDSL